MPERRSSTTDEPRNEERNTAERGDKRKAFVRLAEARVGRALDALELLGLLGDATRYVYDNDDIERIANAIDEARDHAISALEERRSIRRASFSLQPENGT